MIEKTLLLVDDEEDIRDILWIPLTDMGYTVYTAENGAEALDIFRKKMPPIVITDIKMPGIDGIELLKSIKAENPDVQVIMITGHGDMNLAIESFRDDATDFIIKPITINALNAAIDRAKERILLKQKLNAYTEDLEAHLLEKIRLLENSRSLDASSTARDRLEDLFENLPCYISVLDSDLRLVSVNTMFQDAFGGNPGDHCYHVLKKETSPCPECAVQKTFADGKSYQSPMTYFDQTDQPINVLAWTSAIRNESRDITHVMVMSTDISQVDELQDNLSSLGLQLGSVSHGIKGLITGLEGGVYILDSGFSKGDAEQIEEGRILVKQMVDRMKRLVLDLLFYAKDRELNREPVDVSGFIDDVVRTLEPRIQGKSIRIDKDYDGSLTTFQVDPGMLSTALINILDNAIDACLADTAKDTHQIRIGAQQKENRVILIIEDNGIGMDRETRENMFSLSFSTKGKMGTGLGLFISRKIIQQHGGAISVDSELKKGTHIEISIPISQSSL